MHGKRRTGQRKSDSYIEVRMLAIVSLAIVLLALILPSLLRALDANNDNLDDTWEAQYGISTNAYAFTNLVGWWQLNGTNNTDPAIDRSGHGIHGTLSGFPSVAYGPGAFSNALYFTTNGVVNFPTTNSVLSTTNQFTFSAWFQSTNNVSQPATIATWSDAATNGWSVGTDTNGVANVTFFNATTQQTVKGSTGAMNLYDGTWHQVAATYTTNQVATVYVDGVGEATNTITGWAAGAVSSFTFGAPTTNVVNNPYVLDEARLYNRALGASEVPQLPPTYSDLNGTGLTVFDDYLESLNPFSTTSIVTSGFAGSGLTAYYGSNTPTLTKTGGDGQTVAASTFASNTLVVHVTNGSGMALVGAPVTFNIPMYSDGGLSLTSGGTTTTSLSLVTDASGNATVYYKSGPEALLNNTILATAVSQTGSASVTFTAYCGVQSGLALWLKADAGVTVDGSGNVSAWQDQSSAANNAASSGGNRPVLVPNSMYGKPALAFNGSSSYMTVPYNSNLSSSNVTIVAVALQTGLTAYPRIVSKSLAVPWTTSPYVSYELLYDSNGAPYGQCSVSNTLHATGSPSAANIGQPNLFSFAYDGSTESFWQNGTLYGTASFSGALQYGSNTPVFIGQSNSTYFLNGKVAEVLIYNRALTSSERQQVEGSLADKYGLYNPNATWPSAYSSDVQTQITANHWNKSQADAYVIFAASSPPVPALGLVEWLKADAGVTQSSGNVSAWADQSPCGNNAMQATSGNQPTVVTNALNSKPAISFNGSTSRLHVVDNASLQSNNVTVMTVVIPQTISDYTAIISKPLSNTSWTSPYCAYSLELNPSAVPYFQFTTGGVLTGTGGVQNQPPGTAYVLSSTYDGTTGSIRENGGTAGTGNRSGSLDYGDSSSKDLTIGADASGFSGNPYHGQIAEVLVYNRALTDTERQQVEVYLFDKYGIYSPSATWPLAYSSAVQSEITAHQWNKSQADNYVALQANNPTMLTTGLMMWLKADDTASVTKDGSNNVSTWADETGNFNVTQSGATRPTYVANDINGNAALRFNGSQYLFNANNINLNADITMIAVSMTTSPSSFGESICVGNHTTGTNRGLEYNSSSQVFDCFNNASGGVASPNANTFVTEAVTLDSGLTNVAFYRNGIQTATATMGSIQNTTPGITVGCRSADYLGCWQGDIAEVLIYDHKLTSTEIQQVSVYLANKYGLPYGGVPTISPNGGSYSSSQSVTITTPLTTGSIHYTLDGTDPSASSPTYSSAITLTGSALVNAEVFSSTGAPLSPIASAQFYVNDTGSTGLPTAATGLSVTAASSNELDLSWTLSGQLNYYGIGVYRSSDSGTTYELVALLDPSATSYADTNVVTGTSYQYIVGTLNTSGESDTSASSSVSPPTTTTMTITLTSPSGATPLP